MSGKGGKPRQNPGVFGPNPHLKEMRKREAAERQEAYDKKLAVDIIAELDLRYGAGKGATAVRKKLAKRRMQKEWAAEPAPANPAKRNITGARKPS